MCNEMYGMKNMWEKQGRKNQPAPNGTVMTSVLSARQCLLVTTKKAQEQPKEVFQGIHVRLWVSQCLVRRVHVASN